MKILVFIILVSVIGGFIFTLFAKPIKKAKNVVVDKINRSFEEDEKETEKNDR